MKCQHICINLQVSLPRTAVFLTLQVLQATDVAERFRFAGSDCAAGTTGTLFTFPETGRICLYLLCMTKFGKEILVCRRRLDA